MAIRKPLRSSKGLDVARPLKPINEEQVLQLAAINCSHEEMAAVLDCSEDTLQRRFAAVIKKGRSSGRMSLKRKQWEMAMNGNITMLIWLGKQNLGQSDKVEQRTQLSADVRQESSFKSDIIEEFKSLVKLKYNGDSKS